MTKNFLLLSLIFAHTSLFSSTPSLANTSTSDDGWTIPSWITEPITTTPTVQPIISPPAQQQSPSPILPESSNPQAEHYLTKLGQMFASLQQVITNTTNSPTFNTAQVKAYIDSELVKLRQLVSSSSSGASSSSSNATSSSQASLKRKVNNPKALKTTTLANNHSKKKTKLLKSL